MPSARLGAAKDLSPLSHHLAQQRMPLADLYRQGFYAKVRMQVKASASSLPCYVSSNRESIVDNL